ncbi:MAG: cytochrome C [Planctomycetota bacterium]|nr:MAG: cytochrome C [Planctomycetota bacterium]
MSLRRLPLFGLLVMLALQFSATITAEEPTTAAAFPEPFDTEPGRPQTAEEAANGFRLPKGFSVSVFAAEPDVRNPIAMTWDARGRLWVAENYTYADRSTVFDWSLRDRVLILEDTNGDGKHDSRKVFTDDPQLLTSIEVGVGGVWMMTPPQLVFVPDQNGDDRPDGEAIVALDGFTPSRDNYHTFANGLKFGPDGWLYGRCGASSPGLVGIPGTPVEKRVPLQGGIWRYHPRHKVFEVLSHGTTNPWGHDWTRDGDGFFINTVNGHLWQILAGAHYMRPHSEDPNPAVYSLIDTHADHYHWDTGKHWTDSRNVTPEHDQRGGGHAHSGCLIYRGENWPAEYRDKLMTLNLHGRRVNVERLEEHGCGFVARHEPDMLHAADPWFRGVEMTYGPDGGVYLMDWSDTGECHDNTGIHRSSGRIYKVTYGQPQPYPSDFLTGRTPQALSELIRHPNGWISRHAVRQLVVRMRELDPATRKNMTMGLLLDSVVNGDERSLASYWALFTLGDLTVDHQLRLLENPQATVRAAAVKMLSDAWPLDTIMSQPHPQAVTPERRVWRALLERSTADESGLVRLALSSVLQRVPVGKRLELARRLSQRGEDAEDHNLPRMIWYGLIPVAESDPRGLAEFTLQCRYPVTRQLAIRRLAERIDETPDSLEHLLTLLAQRGSEDEQQAFIKDVLIGLTAGFVGRSQVQAPGGWGAIQSLAATSSDPQVGEMARDLALLFGDGRALSEVRAVALSDHADMTARKTALATLIRAQPEDLREVCLKLLGVRYLNAVAVKGLASMNDPVLGEQIARQYRSFHLNDRPLVIEVLASRPAFARPLLEAIASHKIPRSDLSPGQARQIQSIGDTNLTQYLTEVWGELRESPEEKHRLMAQWRGVLTDERLAAASKSHGRTMFQKTCATCHRLYGQGGTKGPDITGSQRVNLDYLLSNLIDPSSTVGADYRVTVVVLKDGRVLNGLVRGRNARTLTLETAQDRLTLAIDEIEEERTSNVSLMPDGQLPTMTEQEVCDLVAYLRSPVQVPLEP